MERRCKVTVSYWISRPLIACAKPFFSQQRSAASISSQFLLAVSETHLQSPSISPSLFIRSAFAYSSTLHSRFQTGILHGSWCRWAPQEYSEGDAFGSYWSGLVPECDSERPRWAYLCVKAVALTEDRVQREHRSGAT